MRSVAKKKLRLTFSMRKLLGLIFILAIAFAIVATRIYQASVINRLRDLQITVCWNEESPQGFLGDYRFESPESIILPPYTSMTDSDSNLVKKLLIRLGRSSELDIGHGWDLTWLRYFSVTSILRLHSEAEIDLSSISSLSKIEELWVTSPSIGELSELTKFPKLQRLYIACPTFSDVSSVADCKQLEWVWFESCGISDLSPLSSLEHLRFLIIRNLDKLELSDDIQQLKQLTMIDCKMDNLDLFLSSLSELEYCSLGSSLAGPVSLDGLASSTSLLSLRVTRPASVDPLKRLVHLEQLFISDYEFTTEDVSTILGLSELEVLVLSEVTMTPLAIQKVENSIPSVSVFTK